MKILLKSVKIIEKGSAINGDVLDVFINNGIIEHIGQSIDFEADVLINIANLSVSAGWCDMRVHGRNPGFEQKESFESLENAAISGGFTDLALLPNTQPIIQSKEAVSFIKAEAGKSKINFWPYAAATNNCDGKDINELIDLHTTGAIGFTDGEKAISNTDTLLKIIQYNSQINALFLNRAEESKLNLFGQMNEGLNSNLLGLKGMPSIAEEMAIKRDLALLNYATDKEKIRFHFSTISTKNSVKLIREAKNDGLKVSCDVAAHQLIFSDNDLSSFESNYKVKPPFRTQSDIDELWLGLVDGTIDAIVSDHCPHDAETKNIEFDLAEFGIIGLETLFGALNKQNTKLRYPDLIEKLSYNPRKILGLPIVTLKQGEVANLTLFDTTSHWVFEEKDIKSNSKNTPFIGKNMLGKVFGVISKGKIHYA